MANESAEAVPQLQPQADTKPKVDTRPFAEPVVKPKVTDLPVAPPKGEIVVRPKTAPETVPVPKVDTPKLDLPDAPQTPQTPNAPKIEPPKFDPTKLIPPIITGTTATAGKLAADAMNSPAGITTEDKNSLQRLSEFRKQNKLPDFDPDNGETGTSAYIKVDGKEFIGLNTSLGRSIGKDSIELRKQTFARVQTELGKLKGKKFSPDGQAFTHAEADALIKAEKELGKLPKKMTLYVDRYTCNMCYGKTGLPLLAELFGVEELKVIDKKGRILLVRPNQVTKEIQKSW